MKPCCGFGKFDFEMMVLVCVLVLVERKIRVSVLFSRDFRSLKGFWFSFESKLFLCFRIYNKQNWHNCTFACK